jgi:hypothetical protein
VIFFKHLSGGEECAKGIAALEAYGRAQRGSPVARWIRFYVLGFQAELLERLDRLEEALAASTASLTLPATPYGRLLGIVTHTRLLRRCGRVEDAFAWAVRGLQGCTRAEDVTIARSLMREVVRVEMPARLDAIAAAFPDLVRAVADLPGKSNQPTSGDEVGDMANAERQSRLRPLERLALALLIAAARWRGIPARYTAGGDALWQRRALWM